MTHRPYPAYKDSGIEWLGDASTGSVQGIPEHWGVCALKRIASLKSGETINSEGIEVEGRYPVYGGGGFRGYTDAYTHEGEYALIGRQGALCGNINYGSGKFWASEHAVVVSPIHDLETHWIGELLRSMNLNQYSVSAAQPGLSVEAISNLLVPVPPFPEQQAIAAFLDRETAKIDGLVAEQERLIDLLTEKRQAVISHAVTRGLDPSVPLKASGVEWLGQVPEHWEVKRLGQLFRERNEDGCEDLPILSVSIHHGVSDKELDEKEMDRKVTRSDDKSKYKRVESGDLVYNMMRAWQGGFGTVTIEGQVSPAYVVGCPIADFMTTYIERVLRTPQAVEEMKRHSQGVTDFRLRLYWDDFKTLQVPLPPVAEQAEMSRYIDSEIEGFDALMAEARRGIDLLKERRTAIISATVTGKINVREVA